jgi:hypothetical protein
MALNYPDILQHNNLNYALIDSNQLRGSAYAVGLLIETGSIPADKRKVGQIIFESGSQKFYGYYGADVTDGNWNDATKWKSLAAGTFDTGSFITVGNYGITQSISGTLKIQSASIDYLYTLYETASVIYSSGSNVFGDSTSDKQYLNGLISISGSLIITASNAYGLDISGSYGTRLYFYDYADEGLIIDDTNEEPRNIILKNTFEGEIRSTVIKRDTIVFTGNASGNHGPYSTNIRAYQTGSNDLYLPQTQDTTRTLPISINGYYADTSGSIKIPIATTGSNSFNGNQTITGSLLISGSSIITGSLKVSNGITASLEGTASWATYASSSLKLQNSGSYIQSIQISDFSGDVATVFSNGNLQFIFGTPTPPDISSSFSFNSTFLIDRFNNENDDYDVSASLSTNLGNYTLISASLYTGSVLLASTGSGATYLRYAFTKSGSQNYKLFVTSSNPTNGQYLYQSASLSGTLAKSDPTGYTYLSSTTINPSYYYLYNGSTATPGYYIEEGATGVLNFTNVYSDPSNGWTRTAQTPASSITIYADNTTYGPIYSASYTSGTKNIPTLSKSAQSQFSFLKMRSTKAFVSSNTGSIDITYAHTLSNFGFVMGRYGGKYTFEPTGYQWLCWLVDSGNDYIALTAGGTIWNVGNGWTNEYTAFNMRSFGNYRLYTSNLPVNQSITMAIGEKYDTNFIYP